MRFLIAKIALRVVEVEERCPLLVETLHAATEMVAG